MDNSFEHLYEVSQRMYQIKRHRERHGKQILVLLYFIYHHTIDLLLISSRQSAEGVSKAPSARAIKVQSRT